LKVVLASKSPRRAELLRAAGIEFGVRAADVDESVLAGESPSEYVVRVARDKALAVPHAEDEVVLAADTTVVLGSEIMAKPENADDAIRMLTALSGCRHEVITGVCVLFGDTIATDLASTSVWFAPMSRAEIEEYVASGEPIDKAGAYGIQGLASRFVERIDGSYSNVVGLPVALVYRMLRKLSRS